MEEIGYEEFFNKMKKPVDIEQMTKDFVLASLEERPYTYKELEDIGKNKNIFELDANTIWVHRCLSKLSEDGIVEERIADNGQRYYGLVKKRNN